MTTATATATPQINDLIGWMRKNNHAARAARFLVQYFDVVCQTTTWNFRIWGNSSPQQKIFHSLPLKPKNRSSQASETTLRLVCTTWPTWNNGKTLNLTQSSILKWRFRCSSRRSFLNSLIAKAIVKWERASVTMSVLWRLSRFGRCTKNLSVTKSKLESSYEIKQQPKMFFGKTKVSTLNTSHSKSATQSFLTSFFYKI